MAAQKLNTNLFYQLPEDFFVRLQQVRDSLTLLTHCAEDAQRGTISSALLANHLQLLVEQLNNVIEQAAWAGNGA